MFEFVELGGEFSMQTGVTVSSRIFKKAVDRNRIKRLLREAHRLQKKILADELGKQNLQLAVFIIFTGRELPSFEDINAKMKFALERIAEKVAQRESQSLI